MQILADVLANILQMDLVSIDTTSDLENVIYIFKTTAIGNSLTELKAKIMSILDLPADIPVDIEIVPMKKGIILKDQIVKIKVKKSGIGPVENVFAKKYGILRRKPYKK